MEHDGAVGVKDASLVLILSDHSEFKNLSDSHFDKMKHKVIFDTKMFVKSSFEMYRIIIMAIYLILSTNQMLELGHT